MGRLCVKVMDGKYVEHDRRLKNQFINGLDEENIVEEIIRKIIALQDTNEVRSEQILLWAQRVGTKRAH